MNIIGMWTSSALISSSFPMVLFKVGDFCSHKARLVASAGSGCLLMTLPCCVVSAHQLVCYWLLCCVPSPVPCTLSSLLHCMEGD